jgi:hypothetical protein
MKFYELASGKFNPIFIKAMDAMGNEQTVFSTLPQCLLPKD